MTKFIVDVHTLTVKVVVAGPGGVGKTTLLKRYETNNFIPAVSTVGINFLVMDQEVGETVLRTAYWDYAGEDRFRMLFPGYCQGSSGALVAWDTSRIQTLAELPEWLGMIREHNDPDIPIVLLGNKIDTVSEDTRDLIIESSTRFVKEHSLSGFYFTSAKTGEGIENPFAHLGILIVEYNKRKGKA
ncbi:MAG: GTP-binding protein [Candidatus Heimdallarchaeota archaeon]|nr:MAG: GTP-binding protein [Candidatus Heimdallarchaeota archaeon]